MTFDHIEDESLDTPHRAMRGQYDGGELKPYAGRPGAMDAFDQPSRMGNQLRYRDGRIKQVDPSPPSPSCTLL